MNNNASRARCPRVDGDQCFAYADRGYCKCLRDTNFTRPCPFFKTHKQASAENVGIFVD